MGCSPPDILELTGTETFLSMAIPLRTSERATSCGVDTMTEPNINYRQTRVDHESKLNTYHLP